MYEENRASRSARFGEWLGRRWREYRRVEGDISRWLIQKGLSRRSVKVLRWTIHVGLLLVVLVFAFWVALIAGFIVVLASGVVRSYKRKEEWAIGEQYDERNDPFYDPINYSHTVDPRFDDD